MTTKPNSEMLLPLEAVVELAKPATTSRKRRTGSHIVDITEEYAGTSVIITGESYRKKSDLPEAIARATQLACPAETL